MRHHSDRQCTAASMSPKCWPCNNYLQSKRLRLWVVGWGRGWWRPSGDGDPGGGWQQPWWWRGGGVLRDKLQRHLSISPARRTKIAAEMSSAAIGGTHAQAQIDTHYHTITHTITHYHTLSHTHTITHTHYHTHTITHTLSHTITHTLSHTHYHTHTITHTLSHTHTRAHTHLVSLVCV